MRDSIKKGFGFGLTSGIVTTLGLMVGLYASTNSKTIVIGGILVIALADALSDAMGVHVSEEVGKHTQKHVWESTFSTLISKIVFALTFLIPVLLFPLKSAILVSVTWGFLLISIFSFYIAKQQKTTPLKVALEHIIITLFVIIATNFIGWFVASLS